MELEEMKQNWKTLNARLEEELRFRALEGGRARRNRLKDSLRSLWWGQIVQLLVGASMALVFGSYAYDHRADALLCGCGVTLQLWGIAYLVLAAQELARVVRVDFSAPVLSLQRELARLSAWRLRIGPWLGLGAAITWVPLALVGFEAVTGSDLWDVAPTLVWNLVASGVVGVLAMVAVWIGLKHRMGRAPHARSSWVQRIFRNAEIALGEVERFERE